MSFPRFAKIILLDEFKVRKSKIYFIKEKVGKDARLKSLISKESR
jgi:ribosomal protein L19